MIDLNALWTYQEAEQELAAVESELRNTPSRVKLNQLYRLLKNQQTIVTKLNDELAERSKSFNQLSEVISHLDERLDLEKSELETMQRDEESTAEEMTELREDIEKLNREMNSCMKEIKSAQQLVEKLLNDYQSTRSVYSKAKKEYDALKTVCENEKAAYADKIDGINAKIEALGKQVDPALLEKYRKSKLHNSNQPLAKVINNKCSGCNMSLPLTVLKKLENDSAIIECENCGRILFKEK